MAHKTGRHQEGSRPAEVAAMNGVRMDVKAPPICPPMFIRPETEPAEAPAMSAVTAQ